MKRPQLISTEMDKRVHLNSTKLLSLSAIFFLFLFFATSCEKESINPEKKESTSVDDLNSSAMEPVEGTNLKAGSHNYVFLKWTANYESNSLLKHIRRYQLVCTYHYWEPPLDQNADAAYSFIWFNHRQKNATEHYEDRTYKCPLDSHQANVTISEPHNFTHPTYPNYCVDCGYIRK